MHPFVSAEAQKYDFSNRFVTFSSEIVVLANEDRLKVHATPTTGGQDNAGDLITSSGFCMSACLSPQLPLTWDLQAEYASLVCAEVWLKCIKVLVNSKHAQAYSVLAESH